MNTPKLGVLAAAIAGLTFQAIAADPDISKFCATNGTMSKGALERYFIQKKYPGIDMSTFDDASLTLTNSPFAKVRSDLGSQYFKKYKLDPDGQTFTTNDVLTKIKKIDEQGDISLPFYIREKWQDIKYFEPGDPTKTTDPYSKAKPATFSYTHDFIKHDDQWSAHGAIFKDFAVKGAPLLGDFTFLPSVTLDKVTSSDPTKAVDSLVFRADAVKSLPQLGSVYNDLRFGGLYATDVNFRSSQGGGELEWEPFQNHWGLGAYRGFVTDGHVLYRLRAYIHSEAGDVFDAGRNPNLKANNGFVRVGPYAQVDLTSTWVPGLSLTATWEDYEALTGNTISTRLFSAGISYAIDPKEHFTIEAKYKNGRQPLTAERQESFELDIGVKF